MGAALWGSGHAGNFQAHAAEATWREAPTRKL